MFIYKLPTIPHSRFGDWNSINVALREETDRMGGNPYRAKYLLAIKKRYMKTPEPVNTTENPYDIFAQKFFDRYKSDYAKLCQQAVTSGFAFPIDPITTLHREWLEERVKKMEYMLNDDGIGWSDEIKGFNTALQTLIEQDKVELQSLVDN